LISSGVNRGNVIDSLLRTHRECIKPLRYVLGAVRVQPGAGSFESVAGALGIIKGFGEIRLGVQKPGGVNVPAQVCAVTAFKDLAFRTLPERAACNPQA
jgi:hypothetical protein